MKNFGVYQIENFQNFSKMVLFFTLAQSSGPQWPFSTNHTFFWDTLYSSLNWLLSQLKKWTGQVTKWKYIYRPITEFAIFRMTWSLKYGIFFFNVPQASSVLNKCRCNWSRKIKLFQSRHWHLFIFSRSSKGKQL